MRDHQDKVVGRWSELVVAGLRGRSSVVEVRHELDDLYALVLRVMPGADERAAVELRAALAELSTPVIRLWDGVIAVPLVGTLDSARTQLVMEKLLETLVATGADHAVLDITGVLTVDTEVAQHLLKTVSAARLLGAECIISGIRPQVAHTIVSLGIEFGDIATKATLADALAHALDRRGQRIEKQSISWQRTEPQKPGPA